MRILFDLIYPGYLRYFDAPIKELARRGHEVEVCFVNDRKQPEGIAALADEPRVRVGGARPRAEAELHYALRAVRSAGDYLLYLDPAFADAVYLRRRASAKLPFGLRWLGRLDTIPGPTARTLVAASLRLDAAAPVSDVLSRFVRDRAPDVVVAAPGVFIGGPQAVLVEAARANGVPTVVAVASWDNLTTKGILRGSPDRVLVWNAALAEEAVRLHRVPRARVRVTGAPAFDKWFGRSPARSSADFANMVGLPPDRPYLLFVGSTQTISNPDAELRFVREWIAALRRSGDPRIRELGVLVRPHPYNSLHWAAEDLAELPAAAVWPRGGANPVDEDARAVYFDSIHHAVAVVGINTSAMVEAAIVGRPVFTVTPREFADTQTGTVHFRHLLPENGGFVRRAFSLEEHLAQLGAALRDDAGTREQLDAFVRRFIRPLGLDRDATSAFVAEVEEAAAAGAHEPAPAGPGVRLAMRALGRIGWLERAVGPQRLSTRLSLRARADRARVERLATRLDAFGERTGAPARSARRVRRIGEAWAAALDRLAGRIHAPPPPGLGHVLGTVSPDPADDLLEIDA